MTRRPFLPAPFFRMLPLVTIGATCVLSAGCVAVSSADGGRFVEREEKRFSVEGKPDVKLSTMDGSIEIRSWDRSDVLVVVEKRALNKQTAAAIQIASNQDGNHISVEAKMSGERVVSWLWGGFGNAKLIVSLPAASDVQARTRDGSIDIEQVRGVISLRSGDGRIRGRDASGTVSVQTGDGSIKLDGISGTLEANTGDGGVSVAGTLTGLHVRSGDGSIAIHAQRGSSTEADWDISSGDGPVTLEVPDGFGGELDARTGDGRVRLDGVTLSNVDGEFGKSHMKGRLGAGGHAVRVRTGDGSILLRRY
jgi:DUF4097 and DUF4098 domain-containing protein YvlB